MKKTTHCVSHEKIDEAMVTITRALKKIARLSRNRKLKGYVNRAQLILNEGYAQIIRNEFQSKKAKS